jgi:hypothetical protein
MTDAEYLVDMAEFVPPWHQEIIKKVAKRLEHMNDYISYKAICLCCTTQKICVDECSFSTDFPELYDEMFLARKALYGDLE